MQTFLKTTNLIFVVDKSIKIKEDLINGIPVISVIIPFYNVEKYIGGCLDSIITGTRIRCEMICVDDGSTDSSAEIVKGYCAKNNGVRLVTLPKKYKRYNRFSCRF